MTFSHAKQFSPDCRRSYNLNLYLKILTETFTSKKCTFKADSCGKKNALISVVEWVKDKFTWKLEPRTRAWGQGQVVFCSPEKIGHRSKLALPVVTTIPPLLLSENYLNSERVEITIIRGLINVNQEIFINCSTKHKAANIS